MGFHIIYLVCVCVNAHLKIFVMGDWCWALHLQSKLCIRGYCIVVVKSFVYNIGKKNQLGRYTYLGEQLANRTFFYLN